MVADGTYKIRVEFTWAHGGSTANTTYTFVKGPTADTQTPANQTEFQDVSIDWQPTSTGVSEVLPEDGYVVYPNPVEDYINIKGNGITNIEVHNLIGELISAGNSKYVDMAGQPSGIYIVSITNGKGTFTEKIFKR